MAVQGFLSNDGAGFYEDIKYSVCTIHGEVTADANGRVIFASPGRTGKIVYFQAGCVENGSDGSNALSMAVECKKNGTTILTTPPAWLKTAASDSTVHTGTAGTGITVGVLSTTAATVAFDANDIFTVDFDITRTASPTTEITGPWAIIGYKFDAV